MALSKLRDECNVFLDPFSKQKLNIGRMHMRKMLSDAYTNGKGYVLTLRNMGVKTRLRVRNKGLAKELLKHML